MANVKNQDAHLGIKEEFKEVSDGEVSVGNNVAAESGALDLIVDVLKIFKPHDSAGLRLNVIPESSKRNKLLPAAFDRVEAVVNGSAVDGRVEMSFQTGLSVEEARAKVALKLQTVEADDRRIFLDLRTGRRDSNQAKGINALDDTEEVIDVQPGCNLAAGALEMMNDCRRSGEAVEAEGALVVVRPVDVGLEVLHEWSIQSRCKADVGDTYHLQVQGRCKVLSTLRTGVLPMSKLVHVDIGALLCVEQERAGLAGDARPPMTCRGHMLLAGSLGTKGFVTGVTVVPHHEKRKKKEKKKGYDVGKEEDQDEDGVLHPIYIVPGAEGASVRRWASLHIASSRPNQIVAFQSYTRIGQ